MSSDQAGPSPGVHRPGPTGVRQRSRLRVVVVVLLSELALLCLGAIALVLMLDYRHNLSNAVRKHELLESQFDDFRARLLETVATRPPGKGRADRIEHYVRQMARDLPDASGEIYNDPDLGNVAEFLYQRLRYAGDVLPEGVAEQMVRELSDFRNLAPHAKTVRDYHRFIESMPQRRRQ